MEDVCCPANSVAISSPLTPPADSPRSGCYTGTLTPETPNPFKPLKYCTPRGTRVTWSRIMCSPVQVEVMEDVCCPANSVAISSPLTPPADSPRSGCYTGTLTPETPNPFKPLNISTPRGMRASPGRGSCAGPSRWR